MKQVITVRIITFHTFYGHTPRRAAIEHVHVTWVSFCFPPIKSPRWGRFSHSVETLRENRVSFIVNQPLPLKECTCQAETRSARRKKLFFFFPNFFFLQKLKSLSYFTTDLITMEAESQSIHTHSLVLRASTWQRSGCGGSPPITSLFTCLRINSNEQSS